jgi:hypothetical protein
MATLSWREIRKALRDAAPEPPSPSPDAFWEDFRARARLHPQRQPGPSARRLPLLWTTALSGACAVLVLAGFFLAGPAAGGTPSRITSVEVPASHGAVFILNDEPSQGTILWVVDMTSPGIDGETT